MEKEQLDQYDMSLSVENHFNDNTAPWTGNAPLAAAKAVLTQKNAVIGAQLAIQLINTTGIAANKEVVRKNFEDQLFVVSSAVSGYASTIGNNDLYNRTYKARSTYTLMKDVILTGSCVDLMVDANAEIANLAPYGVVPATLTALNATMLSFSGIKADPEKAIARRKAATEKIAELMPDLMNFFNTRLDNLIVAIEATQEAFVDIYRNVRLISSSPTTTISLTTTCVDSITHLPIEGVELTVLSNNTQRTSPTSGVNIFKNLPAGDDKMQLDHPLYISQTVDYTLVNNQTIELVFALVHK